jgi:type II secretory pathway pseudopilin PulG
MRHLSKSCRNLIGSIGLIFVLLFLGIPVAHTQIQADKRSRLEANRLDQTLDQYNATETMRTDAKKFYGVLVDNNQKTSHAQDDNQEIWNPTMFGVPCKENSCQHAVGRQPVPGATPTSSPATTPCDKNIGCEPGVGGGGGGQGPSAPPSPCGKKGACNPSVGGGGGGQGPSSPSSPCGKKGACNPSVGGGGLGPTLPISPCGATSSCGPSVGGYGGVYDEKALQIMLHTNAVQPLSSQPGDRSSK